MGEIFRKKYDDSFFMLKRLMKERLFEAFEQLEKMRLELEKYAPIHQKNWEEQVLKRSRDNLDMNMKKLILQQQKLLADYYERLIRYKDQYPCYPIAGPEGVITSIGDVKIGDELKIYVSDGVVSSEVKGSQRYDEIIKL